LASPHAVGGRFCERFQVVTPWYNSRAKIAPTVDGDPPCTGRILVRSFRMNGMDTPHPLP
jgi:hypothetical protein